MFNRVLRRLTKQAEDAPPSPAAQATPEERIATVLERKKAASEPILLNLGCGSRMHPDWINIDFVAHDSDAYQWDLTRPLPTTSGVADCVYASHVLEHFTPIGAERFLAECRRLLKPGGIIRIVVPDLEVIAREYLANLDGARSGDAKAQARYRWSVIELLDQMVRHRSGGAMRDYWLQDTVAAEDYIVQRVGTEYLRARTQLLGAPPAAEITDLGELGRFRASGEVHLWMYDSYSLGQLLGQCGFVDVAQTAADQSRLMNFKKYDLDTESDGSVYKPDSLFIEALRSGDP